MENEEERAGYSNPELQLAYAHVCSCIGMTLRHPLVWFMDWTNSTQKHFVSFCHCSCIITLYYYYWFYLSMYFKQHAGWCWQLKSAGDVMLLQQRLHPSEFHTVHHNCRIRFSVFIYFVSDRAQFEIKRWAYLQVLPVRQSSELRSIRSVWSNRICFQTNFNF